MGVDWSREWRRHSFGSNPRAHEEAVQAFKRRSGDGVYGSGGVSRVCFHGPRRPRYGLLNQVVGGEVAVPSELYKTMYPAIAALGTLAVVTSLVYRVRNARLMRQQMTELTAEQAKAVNDTASENRAQEEDAGSASPISPGELVAGSARFASRRSLAASENPDRTGSASPGSPAEHDARVVRRQLTLRGLGRKATLLQPVGPSQSLAREEVGLATRQARRYEYELKQSHRVLIMQSLHLLTVVVQGMCTI